MFRIEIFENKSLVSCFGIFSILRLFFHVLRRKGDLWCVRLNLMKGKSCLQQPTETLIEDPGNSMVLEQLLENSRLEKLEADLARCNRVEHH